MQIQTNKIVFTKILQNTFIVLFKVIYELNILI